jgi:hypothetical protein
MTRTKVKGTMFKAASNPEQEPNFYIMPPVVVSSHRSDDETCDSYTTVGVGTALASEATNPAPIIPLSEPSNCYYSQPQIQTASAAISQTCAYNQILYPTDADTIVDQAVDELFLNRDEVDGIEEFIQDWDPSFEQNYLDVIDDDVQLGYYLESVLLGNC